MLVSRMHSPPSGRNQIVVVSFKVQVCLAVWRRRADTYIDLDLQGGADRRELNDSAAHPAAAGGEALRSIRSRGSDVDNSISVLVALSVPLYE